MDSRVVSERITRMAWIDKVAIPLQKLVEKAYRAMGPVGRKVEDALHGEFLGHPLHPVTVHLPVGAWLLAALLDPWGGSLAARSGADLAVALGFVGALFASATGATDYYVYGDASIRRIGGLHAILNWAAILLYGMSWMARAGDARDFARLLSYVGFAAVGVSGYLGGLLVYEKRIGTNHAPIPEDEAAPEEWVAVGRLEELPDCEPFRADAGDVALVLVRRGDTVDAFAEKCSHQGAPLADGKVVDGCLECPWHQTRFGLATGKVVRGPGVFVQPKYPVRVVDGVVEVSATMPYLPLEVEAPEGRASLM